MSNLDNESEFTEPKIQRASGSYVSPLLRSVGNTKLTVELLREQVPVVNAGQEAQEKLNRGRTTSQKTVRELRAKIKAGEKAKETLFNAALPLIRTIAQKEYRRRQQWASQIPMDDLMQDAIIGFFKGLRIFDTQAINKSATNYLGQWMLSEMRRAAESMDHDLQVGHDAGERFRRIRAIRSRLAGELGREPTDEEIVDASTDPNYVVRPGMVGRAPIEGQTAVHAGKGITFEQITDEKANRERLGSATRFTASSNDSDDGSGESGSLVDIERTISNAGDGTKPPTDPAQVVSEFENDRIIAGIVQRVLDALSLPEQQIEIISRRYGLAPYEDEQSARFISKEMGIHREKISRVLSAFIAEMITPGATLHQMVKDFSSEDLYDLGLGWLTDSLGEWLTEYEINTHTVSYELTKPISNRISSK